jgi:hypothetical protein
MAEIECAVLSKQGLDQRLPIPEMVRRTTAAWASQRNAVQATVNWRFTLAKARRKRKRLYPSQPLC